MGKMSAGCALSGQTDLLASQNQIAGGESKPGMADMNLAQQVRPDLILRSQSSQGLQGLCSFAAQVLEAGQGQRWVSARN